MVDPRPQIQRRWETQVNEQPSISDRLLTYKQAAEQLGIPYFKIQRAAAKGLIPVYSLFNSRKYVRLSDIIAQLRKH